MESDRRPVLMEEDNEEDSGRFRAKQSSQSGFFAGLSSAKSGSNASRIFYVAFLFAILFAFLALVLLIAAFVRLSARKSEPEICTNADCLWEANELLNSMNRSVEPCDDFYEHACGNFPTLYPTSGLWDEMTVFKHIDALNEDKLKRILERSIDDPLSKSFETKLRVLFQSCKNEYLTTQTGGKPLIDAIYNLGGWTALVNRHYTGRSLNSLLQQIHNKYGASAFFKLVVKPDFETKEATQVGAAKYVIQISPADLGMLRPSNYLYDNTYTRAKKAAYRTFIMKIIKLLQVDRNYTTIYGAYYANLAFDDVYFIEKQLANLSNSAIYHFSEQLSHKPISWFEENLKGPIQWYSFIREAFPEAQLSQNTIIHIHQQGYLRGIVNFIASLNDRQINNYIMWKLTANYIQDLGWEYIHANRLWSQTLYDGYVRFVGKYNWCIIQAKQHMGTALDALYVENHFAKGSSGQVSAIGNFVKQAVTDQVDAISWMDADTKTKAKEKLTATGLKLGYPDWLAQKSKVDDYYSTLNVKEKKHFENMVEIWTFSRRKQSALVSQPLEKSQWLEGGVFGTKYYFDHAWNQFYAPAGLLQHPIFDQRLPQYLNFGSFGSLIGRTLIEAIDESGSQIGAQDQWEDWWSAKTQQNWNTLNLTDCHANIFRNASLGFGFWGEQFVTNEDALKRLGRRHMADLAGLNAAYKAYKNFVAKYGSEAALPGLQHESEDQSFFLSYAQTFCSSRHDYFTYVGLVYYNSVVPEKLLLNKILLTAPEFGQAFKCSKDSPMLTNTNSETKQCPGF